MKTWSTSEEIVLRHFFTNIDRDVYCATDAMPTSLWAFLEGGYSRSQVTMRERFLDIFVEMRERDDSAPTIEELAESIAMGRLPQLEGALDKASHFMSKWAVEYGHNSLKDSSVDRFALENVSQRAAKLLEHSSQGAFQEKSTRYLDFSKDEFSFPVSLLESSLGEEARWQATQQMHAYREVLEQLREHFLEQLPKSQFRTEAAWKRTAFAKAFDVARYLLPCSVRTSLGATFPTRETERHISALLASPHDEIRTLAVQMQREAERINPGLLRHVQANTYLERTLGAVAELAETVVPQLPAQNASEPSVQLAWISPEIETLALASALQATERFTCSTAELCDTVRARGPEWRTQLADALFRERGDHDEWPRELAVGQIGFDIVLDFGAWRDLQRHRVGLMLRARPMATLGYSTPAELQHPALSGALETYLRAMDRTSEFYARLVKERPWDAEYAPALGHHTAWTYACDLRQWAYLVELRSGASGHQSYRDIAHRMARCVLPYIPHLATYLRVDWSGESDRRVAEERIQAKLAQLAKASE